MDFVLLSHKYGFMRPLFSPLLLNTRPAPSARTTGLDVFAKRRYCEVNGFVYVFFHASLPGSMGGPRRYVRFL